MAEHTTRTVREHYAKLAEGYDDGANAACKRAYERLIPVDLRGCARVLEIGAGASPLLDAIGAPFSCGADLSHAMLSRRNAAAGAARVVADMQQAPFPPSSFDGVYSLNVMEHVPDPAALLRECHRLLAPGGRCALITPNGGVAGLLELLERLRLKLPEGPHRFVDTAELRRHAEAAGFRVERIETLLAFPAGPDALVQFIDRCCAGKFGLFLHAVFVKP
ncbi:MAG: methyltransferase domain-containing protein [Candidatus Hydrogenedens sp.]|nr:methyltransferase domain-containing protein [Candidatus Hydrogenedens sp.]